MKKIIKNGYTNVSYKKDNFFFQEKKYNQFNHKIDYSILKSLDFIPELIDNSKESISYEWIENKGFEINDENLIKIADIMKKIHKSKLNFPNSNHAARIKKYREVLKEKSIKIPVLEEYYKKINLILRNMKKDTPLHNDLWTNNILVDKNNKIWIIDWEYASKGDKHFDLAYFIESCRLSDEQETTFLNAYDDYDYEYVLQHRILVLYLIILWINAQDVKPFDDKEFFIKIKEVSDILDNRKNEWKNKTS
ncbi:phosphotransferase [Mesomycoplasma molare]|uniref:Phosphotransferase n=1 Tax=Mesomycoplasma molare TaxID=171288 RepID=A0ABY5TUS7_9BACT|nr:phosphotransferase [Mesomycoplasma molare]UWD34414.1 phosphotransferase [Mesomycoplasma molare]